jgi:PadR family transcriptional regulator, regulatory protein AphA
MSLDHAILGFLASEPLTGYDLKTRCFDRVASHLWTADQAQVYRTLERLEKTALVTSRLIPQPGRPDRKEYAITTAGRRALREWLVTPHPLPPLRDPLLLQLFFAGELSNDALVAVLDTARDGFQRRLEGLRGDAARSAEGTGTREATVRRMTLDGAMTQARAAIDWIDDCKDRIAGGLPVNGDARGARTD